MDKIMDRISSFVEPLAEWVHKMTFLQALAEAMQCLLPITVVGSFGCLFAFLDVGGWQSFLAANPILLTTFMNVQSWTLSIIAFYTVMVLPYLYAKRLNFNEPLEVVPLAVAAFILLTPTELYTSIPSQWLGHAGMFSVFIISFLVVRFVKLCQDHNVTIRMPEGVPHYIEATFAVLIPAVIIAFGCGLLGQALALTEFGSIHQLIYTFIQTPIQNVGTGFIGVLIQEIMMTLAMFCGIHGSSVVPWQQALMTAADEANAAALAAGEIAPNIFSSGMMNSIQMGGIGATLGLAIVMVIICKAKRYKQLARLAIVPQIFNIGEPLLFGIPIMLNPLLFIPYMGGVIMNTIVVYGSIAIGIVSRTNGVNPSWTMPGIIQGLLTFQVPWQGMLLQVFIIVMDMLIWLPFVRMMDKQALEEENAVEESEQAIA